MSELARILKLREELERIKSVLNTCSDDIVLSSYTQLTHELNASIGLMEAEYRHQDEIDSQKQSSLGSSTNNCILLEDLSRSIDSYTLELLKTRRGDLFLSSDAANSSSSPVETRHRGLQYEEIFVLSIYAFLCDAGFIPYIQSKSAVPGFAPSLRKVAEKDVIPPDWMPQVSNDSATAKLLFKHPLESKTSYKGMFTVTVGLNAVTGEVALQTENNGDAKTMNISTALAEEYQSPNMQQMMSAHVSAHLSDDDKMVNDVPVKFAISALRDVLFRFLRQEWGMQNLRTGMENFLAVAASNGSGAKNESLDIAVGLQYSSISKDSMRADQLVPDGLHSPGQLVAGETCFGVKKPRSIAATGDNPINPLNVGSSDLYGPTSDVPSGSGNAGNHVGPNHSIFNANQAPDGGDVGTTTRPDGNDLRPGGRIITPQGSIVNLPQPRFDPYGPVTGPNGPDVGNVGLNPPTIPVRGGFIPGHPTTFPGEPTPDHLLPPGNSDLFPPGTNTGGGLRIPPRGRGGLQGPNGMNIDGVAPGIDPLTGLPIDESFQFADLRGGSSLSRGRGRGRGRGFGGGDMFGGGSGMGGGGFI